MNLNDVLSSEEEIRSKIVIPWLLNHGFSSNDVSVEKSFDIKLGRGIYRILSASTLESKETTSSKVRADLLVRSNDGRNLLIIEVKAPTQPLDNEAKTQALSYARLQIEGGIVPFTILTNGHETKIFDSVTGELINGAAIPINHPYVKNNFRVTCSDIALQSEALKALISLSPETLLYFCKNQVEYRMRFLRGDDIFSGKKYIPSLYVERKVAQEQLQKKFDELERLVLLVGLPQQGKTCLMCHLAETTLSKNLPCLFYPAIGLQHGLLEAICEDFEWALGDSSSAYHITRRLSNILNTKQQKLIIFIDGWNEVDKATALVISEACHRLNSENIIIVLSATHTALPRLLFDSAGNPTYVKDTLSLRLRDIDDLTIDPRKFDERKAIVSLAEYNEDEAKDAFEKYKKIYSVTAPANMDAPKNPFLLRIAMENYAGKVLPPVLDEPELIRKSLFSKAVRAGFEPDKLISILSKLGNLIVLHGVPLRLDTLEQALGIQAFESLPHCLFDSAILAKVHDSNNVAAVDLYYGRERDFAISYLARSWPEKLLGDTQTREEILFTGQAREALDALGWFLSIPENLKQLKNAVEALPKVPQPIIKQTVLSALNRNRANRVLFTDSEWIDRVISWVVKERNYSVREIAAQLITTHSEVVDWWWDGVPEKAMGWLIALLEGDEGNNESDEVGEFTLELLQELHWNLVSESDDIEYRGESVISEFLFELLDHVSGIIRTRSAEALGHICPRPLLRFISERINAKVFTEEESKLFESGALIATGKLQEEYYGYMCPGSLGSLKDSPDLLREEFNLMRKICGPVIIHYHPSDCSRTLLDILLDLKPDDEEPLILEDKRNQLPLPFLSNHELSEP
jgi:hypothetical protein